MITYLAGPINGCTDDEANNWRDLAKKRLGVENCLDPMRRDYRGIEDQSTEAIVHGDLEDIDSSDVMLANCWQVSWGTAMEIFYAAERGIRVFAVVPKTAKISPWLRYHAEIFFDLDDALDAIQ